MDVNLLYLKEKKAHNRDLMKLILNDKNTHNI